MNQKFLAREKVDKIRQEFKDDSIRTGYVTMNTNKDFWKCFTDKINQNDDIEFVEVEKPIYFKISDKQYMFDPSNPQKLRKHLQDGLNQLFDGVESLIDTLNELDLKTANTDGERLFVERNIKLRELLVKSGKVV